MSEGGFDYESVVVPPGVTPNYVDPPDHTTQTAILHSIILTLITIFIILRMYTRIHITKNVGADDYMAVTAWVLSVSWSATFIASQDYGVGRHMWDIPREWFEPAYKFLFVITVLYLPVILFVKLAFFLFFYRVFGVQKILRWLILFGIIANVLLYTVVFFYSIFACRPIALAWNPVLDGTCDSIRPVSYLTGIFGFISDFYILFLPIPVILKLNVKQGQRIKLLAAISIGLFACIASIVRFVFTIPLVNDYDTSWNYVSLSIWTVLEVNVGLICACILALPAFLDRYRPSTWKTYFTRLRSRFGTTEPGNKAADDYASSSSSRKNSNKFEMARNETPGSRGKTGYSHLEDGVPDFAMQLRGETATPTSMYRSSTVIEAGGGCKKSADSRTPSPLGVSVTKTVDVDETFE